MNNIYLYDGSFNSLINLIYTLINNNIIPNDIKTDEYNNLIDNFIYLKELKEYDNILSNELMYIIYKVYLSNDERKELILYYFIIPLF